MIKRAWIKYRARKSTIGIWFDFILLAFVITLCVPNLRFMLQTGLVRLTLCQPVALETILFVGNSEYFEVKNLAGIDTTLNFSSDKAAVLYNFGSIKNPQTCAELRTLNKFAKKYRDNIDVIFLTDDEPDEVKAFFDKRNYIIKPLFFELSEHFLARHDMVSELCSSLPASLLVNEKGRIIIKKFGAAKWSGSRIDAIIKDNITSVR